jgi:folate-binding protein YgfZ
MTGLLEDRAVIAISGGEAKAFLQGLITNDVEELAPGKAIYAALLTPQGKILFDFFVAERSESLILDCWVPARESLLKRLLMYRLRAKLNIVPRDDLAVAWDRASALEDGFEDPRQSALGRRAIVGKAQFAGATTVADGYLDRRLSFGVPEGVDFGQDQMFALDAGLEELNGVSFDKGCYVGQELTARMKHRGTARKRLLFIESVDGAPLPILDTPIRAVDRELGVLTSVYGSRGFALIRLDRLEESAGAEAEADGHPIRIVKQAWLAR